MKKVLTLRSLSMVPNMSVIIVSSLHLFNILHLKVLDLDRIFNHFILKNQLIYIDLIGPILTRSIIVRELLLFGKDVTSVIATHMVVQTRGSHAFHLDIFAVEGFAGAQPRLLLLLVLYRRRHQYLIAALMADTRIIL